VVSRALKKGVVIARTPQTRQRRSCSHQTER
jgi:hypothetical protein